MSIIEETYAEYALVINFKLEKTQCVASLVGDKVRLVKEKLFLRVDSSISFKSVSGIEHLRVVSDYVHLGTSHNQSGLIKPELKRRKRVMNDTFVSDLGPLLKSKWVTNKNKETTTNNLCLDTRLLFHAHT